MTCLKAPGDVSSPAKAGGLCKPPLRLGIFFPHLQSPLLASRLITKAGRRAVEIFARLKKEKSVNGIRRISNSVPIGFTVDSLR
jgi:hypothetical protein